MRLPTLVLLAALTAASALYSSSSKVIQLTDKDFKQVTRGDELWLVEFYAPYGSRAPPAPRPALRLPTPRCPMRAAGAVTVRTSRRSGTRRRPRYPAW